MQDFDWNIIVERKPQGYIELNNGGEAFYGPIESVEIDSDDWVKIKVKWVIERQLGEFGVPVGDGKWKVKSSGQFIILEFPNLIVPFEIEDTPEKGPRARFGLSVIYFNNVQKVDPSEVEDLQISAA